MKGKKEKKREQKDWMDRMDWKRTFKKTKAVGKESAFREDKTRKEAWPQRRDR
jgi:hypothetical protein